MKKESSYRKDDHGRVVGKDTTRSYNDGRNETTHQKARGDGFGGIMAGKITGVTKHQGGKSTYKKG